MFNGDIKCSAGLLWVQHLDMGEGKVTTAPIQLSLPLAIDIHFGDSNEVAHLQSIRRDRHKGSEMLRSHFLTYYPTPAFTFPYKPFFRTNPDPITGSF